MGRIPLGWFGSGFMIRDHTYQLTRGRKWPLERQEISWAMRNLTLPKDMPANKMGCVPNYALSDFDITRLKPRNPCPVLLGSPNFPLFNSQNFDLLNLLLNFPTSFISRWSGWSWCKNKMTTLRHAGPDALWFYGKLKVRKGQHSTSGRMRFVIDFFYRNWKIAAFELSIAKRCFKIDAAKAV